MELLESDDTVKSQLLRKSAQHRKDLEENVKLISDKTETLLTNALIIGGTLAATYFTVRYFSSSRKTKAKRKKIKYVNTPAPAPVIDNDNDDDGDDVLDGAHFSLVPAVATRIGAAIASQATYFLLDLAKEKLVEFLQSQGEKKKEKE